AIITEKALICAQSGINLCVDLDIPDRLSVEKIHLCSIFGNLLDNAINACKLTDSAEQPIINLRSTVDGDYLFIKSTNPSSKPPKKRMPGRGYGSRILTDLAARYKGEYRGEYNDGVFTAVVLLLALDGD
ncbi:MAG: ATP-binding protein, partial [Defluviitaleaceae bacterium]|nr:ATP-binding protein [Defluviitaleaceae bacterium]